MYTINHVTTSKGDFYIADNGTASGQGKTPAEAVEDMIRKARIKKVVQLRSGQIRHDRVKPERDVADG